MEGKEGSTDSCLADEALWLVVVVGVVTACENCLIAGVCWMRQCSIGR